ncbi:MAG: hypothetical protein ACI845_001089 [Gammaproteobacteria bacterium]
MNTMIPLRELASIIRSKNAGPYRLTFDILFSDANTFNAVVDSKAINTESVARLYGVEVSQISSMHILPQGLAIKITMFRPRGQCTAGERDVYGCQQHVPLMDLQISIDRNDLPTC